jgi:hypothetical protein
VKFCRGQLGKPHNAQHEQRFVLDLDAPPRLRDKPKSIPSELLPITRSPRASPIRDARCAIPRALGPAPRGFRRRRVRRASPMFRRGPHVLRIFAVSPLSPGRRSCSADANARKYSMASSITWTPSFLMSDVSISPCVVLAGEGVAAG